MPRIEDRQRLRAILETDRAWAAYALLDLSPGFYEHCDWHGSPGEEESVVLVYRGLSVPILIPLGDPAPLRDILAEIPPAPEIFVAFREEARSALESRYSMKRPRPMVRMVLDPEGFHPPPAGHAGPISRSDVPALERLYADGESTGEAPEFYSPSMLDGGVYHGIWEGEALVSVAGTHGVAPDVGVATVGGVYTRRDRRRRGFGAETTGAVVSDLLRMGLETIALNVIQARTSAVHIYEVLGFRVACPFHEGIAYPR
jgi:GNAT superfamily N-acetyltransferase